jgi:diguanylate cyclase (GGDEF)-like protein
MEQNYLAHLKNTYKIDYINDMLLNDKEHIHFYFVLNEKPFFIQIISGDLRKIGLSKKVILTSHEIKEMIKADNEIAEVEGRDTFLDDLIYKIISMDKQLLTYIPIEVNKHSKWLYTMFKKINVDQKVFIFGQVLQIINHTPDEIIHYKKTHQDSLTRLFTRETLKKHLDNLKKFKGSYGIYFDIDKFKHINDQYGHQKGDQLLKDISNMFIDYWEYNVLYYRLGGDEFFIYVYDHTLEQVIERSKKLIHDIENLNDMTTKVGVSASIGIVPITPETSDYHRLLDLGDQNMYISKRQGKGHITVHHTK